MEILITKSTIKIDKHPVGKLLQFIDPQGNQITVILGQEDARKIGAELIKTNASEPADAGDFGLLTPTQLRAMRKQ